MVIVFRWKRVAAGLALLLAAGAGWWIYQSPQWSVAGVLDQVEAAGPIAFFTAQALLPIVGVAVSPFLLVSGAAFGLPVSLAGTAVAQAASLIITYWMATRWLKKPLENSLLRMPGVVEAMRWRRPGVTAFLVSIMPGPSNCMKSYIMALTGVRFRSFMLIGWPVMMGYDTATIFFGEHLLTGNWVYALVVLAGIAVAALGMRWGWSRFTGRVRAEAAGEARDGAGEADREFGDLDRTASAG